MKHLLYIIMFCCPLGYGQGEEYTIAKKALEHFPEYAKYRLICEPNNKYVEKYLNGFYSGEVYGEKTVDLRNIKFTYAAPRVEHWELGAGLWGGIKDKIQIIENFEKIPKVHLTDTNKAETYVRLSNPIFSKDGNHAIISFEHFTNMEGTDAEGFVLIFEKVNNEWMFFRQFTVYLT